MAPFVDPDHNHSQNLRNYRPPRPQPLVIAVGIAVIVFLGWLWLRDDRATDEPIVTIAPEDQVLKIPADQTQHNKSIPHYDRELYTQLDNSNATTSIPTNLNNNIEEPVLPEDNQKEVAANPQPDEEAEEDATEDLILELPAIRDLDNLNPPLAAASSPAPQAEVTPSPTTTPTPKASLPSRPAPKLDGMRSVSPALATTPPRPTPPSYAHLKQPKLNVNQKLAPKPKLIAPPLAPSKTQFHLQIASFTTEEAAKREIRRIRQGCGVVLSGISYNITRVDLGKQGVRYRLYLGPINTREKAESLARSLNRNGIKAIVIKK